VSISARPWIHVSADLREEETGEYNSEKMGEAVDLALMFAVDYPERDVSVQIPCGTFKVVSSTKGTE
jgi:hypothetical protein